MNVSNLVKDEDHNVAPSVLSIKGPCTEFLNVEMGLEGKWLGYHDELPPKHLKCFIVCIGY
jgi:hypothetical protein